MSSLPQSETTTIPSEALKNTASPLPKILAVDDRQENLVALKVMLKNLGAEFITATSGAQALSEILRHEFALILMDIQMPEMDGFEATSFIREYEPTQHVPLIFLTAINQDQVYIQKGYELGAIDYVCKPIEPEILRSKVRGFLDMYCEKIRLQEMTEELLQAQQALSASNQELVRARDLALEGMKAKAEFLATMSHEIRTPMNGIIGMAEFLMDSELTREQRDYVETLNVSGQALLTIINDILDFSKIEAGKMSLETIPFSLRKLVEDCLNLMAIQAHPKGLEVVPLIDGPVPTMVVGDPGRLRQVLLNILGNAVKFTKFGEVIVKVNVVSETNEAVQLRFEVMDTGIGMSEEKQARMFVPFSQGDGSMSREFGGTGLGLTISQKLVNLMGGEIEFESQVNKGTKMWFTVGMPSVDAKGGSTLDPLPPLSVALSFPHKQMAAEVEKSIKGWGGKVQSIGTDDALISELIFASQEKRPFDVLLVDVTDFQTFSETFFQRIGQIEGLAGLRVMIVTALGKPGDGKLARTLGAAAYITKPIKQEQLYQGLCLVMGQNQQENRTSSSCLVTRHTIAEQGIEKEWRILLAEDNMVNQKVAVRMLQKLGYKVDVVMNGRGAVESIKSDTVYHAVLMDCMMPEMDGFTATSLIRQYEQEQLEQTRQEREGSEASLYSDSATIQKNQHLPIIAVTANVLDADKEQCFASGMDDFLPKPLESDGLQAMLKKWISPSAHT